MVAINILIALDEVQRRKERHKDVWVLKIMIF